MIDWERVSDLYDEIGAADFADVVEIFLEEVDEQIADFSDTMAPDKIEGKLHFLNGSALNLGFSAFASLCADGEKQARIKAFDSINMTEIVASYRASKAEFTQSLSTRIAC